MLGGNHEDRACGRHESRDAVGPDDRPLQLRDVDNVIGPATQPIGERKEECEFASVVASELHDEPFARRFEAMPECLELLTQLRLIGMRPPRGSLLWRTAGDRAAAQVVTKRQDFLAKAGDAHRFVEVGARQTTWRNVQDFHLCNYTVYACDDNRTSVAL